MPRFLAKKYCSLVCNGAATRKPPPAISCLSCGKMLTRKTYPGGGVESYTEMESRRFCDHVCHGKEIARPDGPLHGGLPHRGRKIARRKKPRVACSACGTTRRLEVHHKDKDATNNAPDNLEVLCLKCHRSRHKSEHVCRVCGGQGMALGLCSKHYQRFKKYGDPLVKQLNRHTPPQTVQD